MSRDIKNGSENCGVKHCSFYYTCYLCLRWSHWL